MELQCGIEFEEDSSADLTVVSDKKRLTQVMLNLVSNSLKFTQDGFIKIKA